MTDERTGSPGAPDVEPDAEPDVEPDAEPDAEPDVERDREHDPDSPALGVLDPDGPAPEPSEPG